MRKKFKNIITVFLSILCCLLFVEAGFRLFGYNGTIYDYDPQTGLGFLTAKNHFHYIKSCFHTEVTTNAQGFHDREFVTEKAPGVFRIAVVGDSFVQALEVPLEKSFPKILERLLNEQAPPGRKYEVYAFGSKDNGTALNYLNLKNVVSPYQPDLIIHTFYPLNDFRDDSREITDEFVEQTHDTEIYDGKIYARLGPDGHVDLNQLELDLSAQKSLRPSSSLLQHFFRRSALFAWLKDSWKISTSQIQEKLHHRQMQLVSDIPVDDDVFLVEPPLEWQEIWQVEEDLIRAMAAESTHIGAKFLLVSLADSFRVQSEYVHTTFWTEESFGKTVPENRLKEIARVNSIAYLSLFDIFEARENQNPKIPMAFSCDSHWNEIGHAWAARGIYDYLTAYPEILSEATRR